MCAKLELLSETFDIAMRNMQFVSFSTANGWNKLSNSRLSAVV